MRIKASGSVRWWVEKFATTTCRGQYPHCPLTFDPL